MEPVTVSSEVFLQVLEDFQLQRFVFICSTINGRYGRGGGGEEEK